MKCWGIFNVKSSSTISGTPPHPPAIPTRRKSRVKVISKIRRVWTSGNLHSVSLEDNLKANLNSDKNNMFSNSFKTNLAFCFSPHGTSS